MQPTQSRACYNCQHIYFDPGSEWYSCMTPGNDMHLYCEKKHWNLDEYKSTIIDLANALDQANTCIDYEHSDRAKELDIPKPQRIKVPVLCNTCGHVLHEYSSDNYKQLFVHCPSCLKVDSVMDDNDNPIEPHERTKWVKQ